MKAKYTFEIMELDDGMVAVPVGNDSEQFHGVLKVNETAVFILKLLEHETTEDDIVDAQWVVADAADKKERDGQ